MAKRYAFFSSGLPDPEQGGSGIFNWLVLDYLLRKGYEVHAWFRIDIRSAGMYFDDKHLRQLAYRGLKYTLVEEDTAAARFAFGKDLLLKAAGYAAAEREINKIRPILKDCVGALALDMGWGFALAQADIPTVCILADPFEQRLRHQQLLAGFSLNLLNPTYWKLWAQLLSLSSAYSALARLVGNKLVLASFSPYHAKEFSKRGLRCRHFHWFTPEVVARPKAPKLATKMTCLHVGSLYTSASRNMLHYWDRELLPSLDKTGIQIEIRFVGKVERRLISKWRNIQLTFIGHSPALDDEFINAHLFLSPMKYPIGVRTRVLTALSYGVPVLADPSTSCGLPELTNGRDILYGETPNDIVRTIETLYRRPALLEEIGRSGRMTWEKYYTPEKNIMTLVEAIDALAGGRHFVDKTEHSGDVF